MHSVGFRVQGTELVFWLGLQGSQFYEFSHIQHLTCGGFRFSMIPSGFFQSYGLGYQRLVVDPEALNPKPEPREL